MRKIIFLIFMMSSLLFSKEVEIRNEVIPLDIDLGELILLNFPFKIRSGKDIELFGAREKVDVKFKEKTIYFATAALPLKILIYGPEYTIYLEFKEGGNGTTPSRVFTFHETNIAKKKNDIEAIENYDKEIINIVKHINQNGILSQREMYNENIDLILSTKRIEILHKSKYKNELFRIDYYLVRNKSFGLLKLRNEKLFKSEDGVLANIFGNNTGELEYNQKTWVYVFRKIKSETK